MENQKQQLEKTFKKSTRKAYWDSLIAQLKANNEELKNLNTEV